MALIEYPAPASDPAVMEPVEQSAPIEYPAPSQKKVVGDGPIQDQLVSWSNEFGTDPETILRENNITNTGDIKPGQVLNVSLGAAAETSEEDTLLSQLTDLVSSTLKTSEEQPVEDYSEGKFTGPGIDVSLEGKGDLDTTERDFFGETITETRPGTYSVDLTKGSGEGLISEAAKLPEGVTTVPGEGEVTLAPKPEVVEVKPSITGTEVPAVSEGTITAPVSTTTEAKKVSSDVPPPENELLKLQALYKPLGTGKEIYEGVINKIKTIPLPTDFDAKELYQQLAEDAERDTKKIDDAIAEIAEEKIKPTFAGFDKFLAVLGAAMGAYGSAMTGTPNYALQIMNKAIDADQEQFLASKEIRTKTLLDQRQAVLQRRSDLLQLGINQADRMLSIAQQQQDNEIAVANMEAVKLGLENDAKEAHNEQITNLIKVYTDKVSAKLLADTAQTKDQRERGVGGIELTDENGNLKVYGAYLTATPKEGDKHRESWSQTKAISKILDDIDKIAGTAGAFAPASLSNTRTSLENKSSQLIVHLKELYGMGAHFTEFEQALVRQQTPTDALFEQFKVWEQKSKDLRRQLIMKHEARVGSQGGRLAQMPNAADKKKLGPGMKTGVSKK